MLQRIAALLNKLIRPLGMRLAQIEAPVSRVALDRAREFHDSIVATQMPELAARDGRVELLQRLRGTSIVEAMWLLRALHASLPLAGDVCEFGVAQGYTSALLANEIAPTDKRLWLFDSFEGLPAPTEKDELIDDIFGLGSMEAYQGEMSFPRRVVEAQLARVAFPTDRVEIVPGFIEKTIGGPRLPERVCCAYVDFDFYEPIQVALRFLAERMPSGGHIVVDDYGFFSSGAQAAVDEFVQAQAGAFAVEVAPEWSAGRFAVLRRS